MIPADGNFWGLIPEWFWEVEEQLCHGASDALGWCLVIVWLGKPWPGCIALISQQLNISRLLAFHLSSTSL